MSLRPMGSRADLLSSKAIRAIQIHQHLIRTVSTLGPTALLELMLIIIYTDPTPDLQSSRRPQGRKTMPGPLVSPDTDPSRTVTNELKGDMWR